MTTPITKEQLTDDQIAIWLSKAESVIRERYIFSEEYAAARAISELASELQECRKAAMDAEPVAWVCAHGDEIEYNGHNQFSGGRQGLPLYAAPPAPVVPDEMEPTVEAIKRVLPTSNPDEYAACIGADMWNACRAAMLNQEKSNG